MAERTTPAHLASCGLPYGKKQMERTVRAESVGRPVAGNKIARPIVCSVVVASILIGRQGTGVDTKTAFIRGSRRVDRASPPMHRLLRPVYLVGLLLALPHAAASQTMSFDAVVPTFTQPPSFGGCLYREATYQTIASVAMTPSVVTLTLRVPSRVLERYFENPACPATRTLPQITLTYSLARHANVNVQYSVETQRSGVGGVFGGSSGQEHVLYQVYFCAEDGASNCTWSRTVTNRILVSLYYRFYGDGGQTIYGFGGHYLGPNPGRLNVPVITSLAVLPQGFVGEPYGPFSFEGSGGTPPYTWRAETPPPALLSVEPSGALTGSPEIAGNHTFTVGLRDAAGLTASKVVALGVADTRPLVITTPRALPAANVGRPYRAEICAEGGRPPYKFSGFVNTPGLAVGGGGESRCGVVAGTPQLANLPILDPWPAELTPYPVYVTVTDSMGRQGSAVMWLQVTQLPNVTVKTPAAQARLIVSGATQIALGAIASYLGVVYCPPTLPPCLQFMHAITAGTVVPGLYDLMAAYDPPDPDFRGIVVPAPKALASVGPGLPPALTAAANAVVANESQQAALAEAYRLSTDKAEGAIRAGDTCWAGAQLHAAETFAGRLADLVKQERELRAGVRKQLAGIAAIPLTAAELDGFQREVITHGFSPVITDFLDRSGVDATARARVRYLLEYSLVDLREYAGNYGFDVANPNRTLATPEDEAAWRQLAQTRQSANYPCDRAGLSVRTNQPAFAVGETLVTTATLFPPQDAPPTVDAYVVLRLPSGEYLSLRDGGSVAPGIVPFARNISPLAFERAVLHYGFNGSEPRGTYTWHAVLTHPGTMAFVSPLRIATFTLQ